MVLEALIDIDLSTVQSTLQMKDFLARLTCSVRIGLRPTELEKGDYFKCHGRRDERRRKGEAAVR